MTTLESTLTIALMSALGLGTMELYQIVEAKGLAYNEAVKIQTQCYKDKDFKCESAINKFKEIAKAENSLLVSVKTST
jgi:hypothetical protein